MTRPLLSMTAMLLNEAKNIKATIESVRPFIDRWTVLDTGSKDGTERVVMEALREPPVVVGTLHRERFIDFGTTRNRLLDLDAAVPESAVFSLMMSGDERLEGGDKLRHFLEEHRDSEEGSYCIWIQSGQGAHGRAWPYPRILRTDSKWRYVGDVQEVPRAPGGAAVRPGPIIPGVRIVHTESDPERKFKRLREFDLPRLQKRAASVEASLEERAQAIMHLAQTHEALALADEVRAPGGEWMIHTLAAWRLYQERAMIGDDELQASYALLCSLTVAQRVGMIYSSREFLGRHQIVVDMNPELAEAHYYMAVHGAQVNARFGLPLAEKAARVAEEAIEKHERGEAISVLPTNPYHVRWASLRIAAECAKHVENADKARELAQKGIAAGGPPEIFKEFLT